LEEKNIAPVLPTSAEVTGPAVPTDVKVKAPIITTSDSKGEALDNSLERVPPPPLKLPKVPPELIETQVSSGGENESEGNLRTEGNDISIVSQLIENMPDSIRSALHKFCHVQKFNNKS